MTRCLTRTGTATTSVGRRVRQGLDQLPVGAVLQDGADIAVGMTDIGEDRRFIEGNREALEILENHRSAAGHPSADGPLVDRKETRPGRTWTPTYRASRLPISSRLSASEDEFGEVATRRPGARRASPVSRSPGSDRGRRRAGTFSRRDRFGDRSEERRRPESRRFPQPAPSLDIAAAPGLDDRRLDARRPVSVVVLGARRGRRAPPSRWRRGAGSAPSGWSEISSMAARSLGLVMATLIPPSVTSKGTACNRRPTLGRQHLADLERRVEELDLDHARHAELLRQGVEQHPLFDIAELEELGAQPTAGSVTGLQRGVQLGQREHTPFDEDFTQSLHDKPQFTAIPPAPRGPARVREPGLERERRSGLRCCNHREGEHVHANRVRHHG